jgi:thiol-disulfide isomerase/thioredoxin
MDDTIPPDAYTYSGTVPVPDFPPGVDWLNTERPLSITRDLRGKIVLLDFWTLGCINCIHIIPDLKRLENEYPDSLVVIGVHSAKFQTEGESESIRQAILRYRDQTSGVPLGKRRERVVALKRLILLMDGQDGEAEIRRLKEEDEGF